MVVVIDRAEPAITARSDAVGRVAGAEIDVPAERSRDGMRIHGLQTGACPGQRYRRGIELQAFGRNDKRDLAVRIVRPPLPDQQRKRSGQWLWLELDRLCQSKERWDQRCDEKRVFPASPEDETVLDLVRAIRGTTIPADVSRPMSN